MLRFATLALPLSALLAVAQDTPSWSRFDNTRLSCGSIGKVKATSRDDCEAKCLAKEDCTGYTLVLDKTLVSGRCYFKNYDCPASSSRWGHNTRSQSGLVGTCAENASLVPVNPKNVCVDYSLESSDDDDDDTDNASSTTISVQALAASSSSATTSLDIVVGSTTVTRDASAPAPTCSTFGNLGDSCGTDATSCCATGLTCMGQMCQYRCPASTLRGYCAADSDCDQANGYVCSNDNKCSPPDSATMVDVGQQCDQGAGNTHFCRSFSSVCVSGICQQCTF